MRSAELGSSCRQDKGSMQVREMKRDCQVETEQLGLKKTKHTSQVLSSPELIPVFVA